MARRVGRARTRSRRPRLRVRPLWLLVATAAVDAAHAVYRLRHPGDSAVDAIALDMLVIFVVLAVLRPPSAVLPVVLIYLLAPPGIFLATRAAAWAIGSSLVGVSALRWLLPATDPQGAETVAVVAVLAIAVLPAVVWFLAAIAEILSGRRRIEMDLERAASRFEALFDRSVVPMFRTRFDGVLIDANASLVELLRAPDGDALEGISVLRLYEHPARRIRMIESLERWGQVKGLEVDLRRLDGSVFLARITASLVEQDDETVIEGILEDVTDERIAEERERISSQVFNQLGSAVVISDAERRITFWNRCAEEMFGLSEGDVIGKSARDVLKSPRIGDADDVGSRLDSAGFWQGEADVLAEDGTIVQCAVSVSLVETADGSPADSRWCSRTGREERRQKGPAFQAAVLEHVHNAVIATDPDGRVTYWNPAAERMYGWDASEAVGSRVRDLTVPVTGRVAAAEVMETLARNGRWQRELELARRDGSTFSALVTNAVLTDDNGETLGVVSVSADLTDLKQAQDRARDSGDLARSVLESLHSPVAVVDYTGEIIHVNGAWIRFAVLNDGDLLSTGIGANYLDVCGRAAEMVPDAAQAADGLRDVLDGRLDSFSFEYPCHGPREERFYRMQVAPIHNTGAVVSHIDVTADELAKRRWRRSSSRRTVPRRGLPRASDTLDSRRRFRRVSPIRRARRRGPPGVPRPGGRPGARGGRPRGRPPRGRAPRHSDARHPPRVVVGGRSGRPGGPTVELLD